MSAKTKRPAVTLRGLDGRRVRIPAPNLAQDLAFFVHYRAYLKKRQAEERADLRARQARERETIDALIERAEGRGAS